mgnify:CR=1 FL=1
MTSARNTVNRYQPNVANTSTPCDTVADSMKAATPMGARQITHCVNAIITSKAPLKNDTTVSPT